MKRWGQLSCRMLHLLDLFGHLLWCHLLCSKRWYCVLPPTSHREIQYQSDAEDGLLKLYKVTTAYMPFIAFFALFYNTNFLKLGIQGSEGFNACSCEVWLSLFALWNRDRGHFFYLRGDIKIIRRWNLIVVGWNTA